MAHSSSALLSVRAAFAVLAAAALACVAPAQRTSPRFTLPAQPYDYHSVRVPKGHPEQSLRARNGGSLPARFDELATLGRVLFYDRLLSDNRRRSCASCHRQDHGFADDRPLSRGFAGRETRRNSMAIVNLAFRGEGFFWDGRARSLEAMVLMPIADPIEMGLDLDTLVARLDAEPGYAGLFAAAFGDATVTTDRIAAALAAFVRAIVSRQSKYDQGLAAVPSVRDDFPNFTAAENRGKRLFFGVDGSVQHSCAACHLHQEHGMCGHSLTLHTAVLQMDGCRNNGLDVGHRGDDPGRARVTGKPEDAGAFRAPSLRNIEWTAPYMHDGRFRTLEEVVRFYANGVRLNARLDPALQPGNGAGWGGAPSSSITGTAVGPRAVASPPPGLPMTGEQQRDLVAFLKTLSDPVLRTDPRFADPFVVPSR